MIIDYHEVKMYINSIIEKHNRYNPCVGEVFGYHKPHLNHPAEHLLSRRDFRKVDSANMD